MLRHLDRVDGADMSFIVDNETMYAHHLILEANAPDFSTRENPFPVLDTTPEIFRIVLEFIYSSKTPKREYTLEKAKEISDAANQYGVSDVSYLPNEH